ncbi:hypothetical protein [Muriicola marianensis]|uniref:Uncharacterized protein n=1 Tax=Muriicola marianensis TaxID=1324801 RepID=A0ABQ1QQ46_9FLAO|nr:hypothetical protein [Muriicola marianensis]GGD40328.1 hypothetical protein GCM10011361_04310 [Muriicola marianensis]
MKNAILILLASIVVISSRTYAQDINFIFNNNLTLNENLSRHTKAMNGLMASYGKVQTKIYRFQGAFEEAVKNMNKPKNSNVSSVSNQPIASNISMFVNLTEDLNPKPMDEAWYVNAAKKINEFSNVNGKSLTVTIYSPTEQNPDNLRAGDEVKSRIITLSNPYLDLDNLKVIEGTWVSEVVATSVITQEMLDTESAFEDDWDEVEEDMGIDIPNGAQFVEFDVVADTQFLQGDVNYIVEMSTEETFRFFEMNKDRFITNFEQLESISEDGGTITTFYLLEHDGPLKDGDDVISMTIQPAPESILIDVLGLNQGTWTLISINRWIEEGY